MKNQESNYSLKFSEDIGRVSIVVKSTGIVKESFSPCIDDSFIVQRMEEIRKEEIWQQQFMMVPGMTQNRPYGAGEVLKGGLILPDGY